MRKLLWALLPLCTAFQSFAQTAEKAKPAFLEMYVSIDEEATKLVPTLRSIKNIAEKSDEIGAINHITGSYDSGYRSAPHALVVDALEQACDV